MLSDYDLRHQGICMSRSERLYSISVAYYQKYPTTLGALDRMQTLIDWLPYYPAGFCFLHQVRSQC